MAVRGPTPRPHLGLVPAILALLILQAAKLWAHPIKLVHDLPGYLAGVARGQLETDLAVPQLAASDLRLNLAASGSGDDDADDLEALEATQATNSTIGEGPIDSNQAADQLNKPQLTDNNHQGISQKGRQPAASGPGRHQVPMLVPIRRPNGQIFQLCNSTDSECDDKNGICQLGLCVCRVNYFPERKSGICRSIGDYMKSCENDLQCQALKVDLICDSSLEQPACNCERGFYFDQELSSCLRCTRNMLVLSLARAQQLQANGNDSSTLRNNNNKSHLATNEPARPQSLRHCEIEPELIGRFSAADGLPWGQHRPSTGLTMDEPRSWATSNSASVATSSTSYSNSRPSQASNPSSSDPLRIKTPLEVFMGAIMLFTLFTVAWFFLNRMFHDCRTIINSLTNSEGLCEPGYQTAAGQQTPAGLLLGPGPGGPLMAGCLDPNGQAVVRLLASTDGYTSLYRRDLAGMMVQQLAASAAAAAAAGAANSRPLSPDSMFAPTEQSRSLASQLLLSPSHPAIALIRAAAASAGNQSPADLMAGGDSSLLDVLDPPPKYEEAVSQSLQVMAIAPSPQPPPVDSNSLDELINNNIPSELPIPDDSTHSAPTEHSSSPCSSSSSSSSSSITPSDLNRDHSPDNEITETPAPRESR